MSQWAASGDPGPHTCSSSNFSTDMLERAAEGGRHTHTQHTEQGQAHTEAGPDANGACRSGTEAGFLSHLGLPRKDTDMDMDSPVV